MSFEQLRLIEPVLKALEHEGYSTPTPIQQQAIPFVLDKKDLLGCAQTGTGKTAAFAIPLLQLMHEDQQASRKGPRNIKALILTPTRELAIQIQESFTAYGRFLDLKSLVIFGGVSQHPQTEALKRGVDILIATPGRLLDLISQNYITLRDIKYFILDEADRMLDMGFVHDVKRVIIKLPEQRQTLFFSATMPPEIQTLANAILRNPAKVEVTPVSSTAETITQSMYFVNKNDKRNLLLHILKDKAIRTALVFTRTKHGADKVVKDLNKAEITAEAIHGNKSQNARQRALSNFKSQQTRVLVATDIAARGIDIDELTHVINYELPNVPETYVHRIGRTGRAGAKGMAISFCEGEEKPFLKDILKLIARDIPLVTEHPFHNGDNLSAPVQRPAAPKPKQQHPRDKKGGFSRNRQGHVAPREHKGNGGSNGNSSGNGQPRHGQQRGHQQRERSASK
ncbi:DEAD/DEAH box helicase [Chitinophaga ginsengisoli]|uniref:DEAD-box ATP-dependent RNA helicase RhpA n=1 Tax=Chitinophaga ginsengisoli TaxID=363837 RepID=A0A2P8FPJ0_9BACT|nr:DEAD/DEAH box helicase [Chitinophaga ginsengisoli]PSL23650.1 ATP-dependent RNA helicase RhlE [Chitinophaga ginsengisoli]